MNKKLLFGAMALAALTACTTDDFESQKVAQQEASPIQFEVINNNDAFTRASMDGNKIVWSAEDGDLFTLYHACTLPNAGQNATYTASAVDEKPAVLTTPSMILPGKAIMVWPVDTAFNIASGAALSVKIPAELDNIEDNIPYVSDVINITDEADWTKPTAAYNKAGYQRKYPVYMRPMASQLIVKADYAGTDATLATLEAGDDGIEPIKVTSIDLESASEPFTTKIALAFNNTKNATNWAAVKNNAFDQVTEFGTALASASKLTTKVLDGNAGCKFLLLPTTTFTNVADKKVVVNTIYGKVEVSPTVYTTAAEYNDSWYRFVSATATLGAGETKATTAETSGANAGKFKTTSKIEDGLVQTITGFNTYTHQGTSPVKTEPEGAAATRYVKVLLTKLDMSGLHIKTDKQLRDAAKVWDKMNLPSVTVFLDGNDPKDLNGKFEISQTTIAKIKELNTAKAAAGKKFTVKPCNTAKEVCDYIVIKDGGNVPDLDFILINGTHQADVVLEAGKNWNWTTNVVAGKKAIKVDATATGVASIINEGNFASAAGTIAVYNNAATPAQVNLPFENAKDASWSVSGGDLNVQFNVTNLGTVTIDADAEYHQDAATVFTNEAMTLPGRFLAATAPVEIGTVINNGVFAITNAGVINNYGLIEHANENAKTYISANSIGSGFSNIFNADTTTPPINKIGRINLPYSNKDEDNISISGGANLGFVSVTVSTELNSAPADGKLNLTSVGANVNYCIIKSGVTEINAVSNQIKYLEFDAGTTEIAWNLGGTSSSPKTATYDGLIVKSPVNIKLWTTITVTKSTFLNAKMYVGGTYTNSGTGYNGYYGNTTANAATMYITY